MIPRSIRRPRLCSHTSIPPRTSNAASLQATPITPSRRYVSDLQPPGARVYAVRDRGEQSMLCRVLLICGVILHGVHVQLEIQWYKRRTAGQAGSLRVAEHIRETKRTRATATKRTAAGRFAQIQKTRRCNRQPTSEQRHGREPTE